MVRPELAPKDIPLVQFFSRPVFHEGVISCERAIAKGEFLAWKCANNEAFSVRISLIGVVAKQGMKHVKMLTYFLWNECLQGHMATFSPDVNSSKHTAQT